MGYQKSLAKEEDVGRFSTIIALKRIEITKICMVEHDTRNEISLINKWLVASTIAFYS